MATTSDYMFVTNTQMMSNFTENSTSPPIMDPLTADGIIVPVIWALLVITGTVGNGLVIFILSKYGERTVTNIYVVNLAVSDLTFIVIVLPVTAIHFVIPSWIFGEAVCRIFIYLIYVSNNCCLFYERACSVYKEVKLATIQHLHH